jgi:hypothetical protein
MTSLFNPLFTLLYVVGYRRVLRVLCLVESKPRHKGQHNQKQHRKRGEGSNKAQTAADNSFYFDDLYSFFLDGRIMHDVYPFHVLHNAVRTEHLKFCILYSHTV